MRFRIEWGIGICLEEFDIGVGIGFDVKFDTGFTLGFSLGFSWRFVIEDVSELICRVLFIN